MPTPSPFWNRYSLVELIGQRSDESIPLMFALLLVLLAVDVPAPSIGAATVRAVWLADLHPDHVHSGTAGRFVFVPSSTVDEVDGCVLVEAAGPPGVLRTVHFALGETDEDLNVAQPIVVEGELVVIRRPARGEFPAVVELQVREARRVRSPSECTSAGRRDHLRALPLSPSPTPRAMTPGSLEPTAPLAYRKGASSPAAPRIQSHDRPGDPRPVAPGSLWTAA
jgi:hypothetical protein